MDDTLLKRRIGGYDSGNSPDLAPYSFDYPYNEMLFDALFIVDQARRGEEGASLRGTELWGYSVAAFESVFRNSFGEDQKAGFNVFNISSDQYGDYQIVVDQADPNKEVSVSEKGTLFGSIFITRSTDSGKDVLSYSLFYGPNGPLIDRQVSEYLLDFDINLLSSENIPNMPEDLIAGRTFDYDFPALDNQEILSVTGLVNGIVSSFESESSGDSMSFDAESISGPVSS